MINIKQNDDFYDVTFKYDPLVVDLVKNVPGRRWNPNEKKWTIPADKLGFLLAQFKGTQYESFVKIISDEHVNEDSSLDVTVQIPDIDISKIPFYVKEGGHLYNHQLDFMKYAIHRQLKGNMDGFLIADDQGCVAGNAYVRVKLKGVSLKLTLHELHQLWEYSNHSLDVQILHQRLDFFQYTYPIDIVYSGVKSVYKLTLQDGKSVEVTHDHMIRTEYGFIPLENLVYNDRVHIFDESHQSLNSQVYKIEYCGEIDTYDIKMPDPFHNFVANDIVVHNCGKSMESMNLALYNKKQNNFKHCLIICCINSSKYNWVKDIQEHTRNEYTPYILGSRYLKKKKTKGAYKVAGSKEKFEDLNNLKQFGFKTGQDLPYFIILNVEAVRYKDGKKYPIADRLIELMNKGYINTVIIDEVHKNLSPTSQQGKQVLRIKKSVTEPIMWLPMSGTPITKRPTDLFLPLRLINAHGYNSFYMWSGEYCLYGGYGDHEIVGYRNIPRLKSQLQNNMIRRLKSDVLDLPPKIYYDEYVDNTEYQDRLYTETAVGLAGERESILKSLNPLAKFLRLRQVNGNPELVDDRLDIKDSHYLQKNAKLQRLLELLEEIHERGEKVIIFSNWVESLRTLYTFVSKKYKTCCFTGTMKESERQKHKEVFINNPSYTVMMGTFGALGTTHTLTVARNVIMYDEPWNPSDKVQAEDRAYRIGTNQSVNIYTLITRNTVDDRVHDILYTKSGISSFMVDNKLDIMNNPDLFNLLLSDTIEFTRKEEPNDEDYL